MYKEVEKTVREILIDDKKARSNDKYLIQVFLERQGLSTDLKMLKENISFEAITRARRKIQATNPSLRGAKKIKELRAELEEDIKANVCDKGDC